MIDHKKAVVYWKEFEFPQYKEREISIEINRDFIIAVIGPRRVGKTYLCYQAIGDLLKKGVPKSNILYLNFEDDKLLGAEAKDISLLLEAYYEMYAPDKKQEIYLFLDEIQNVKNWDSWVRTAYDSQKNVRLILTGSSSKLLSRELSTSLRGRVISRELFPLSFREFVHWKNIEYEPKTIKHSKQKPEIKKIYEEYLACGGYPSVFFQPALRDTILQSYYETMIFRDIVERHNVKEIKKLKLLAGLIFEATAKEISYNKLANKLKSLGFNISKNTIIEYMSYFEDSYLFFQNMKYEYSLTKQMGSIKKAYCIDNGLLNAVSFKFSEDRGKLMENLAFIELKRMGKTVYYHKGKLECDFVVHEKGKIVSALQVSEILSEENRKREIEGLIEAMKAYGLKEGTVLTDNLEEDIVVEGRDIHIMPIWLWLLLQK